MTRPAELALASRTPSPSAFSPAVQVSFTAGLLEQDGKRYWHVLATNDGRWFHSMERFPEDDEKAARHYLSGLRSGCGRDGARTAEDRGIFHHPV